MVLKNEELYLTMGFTLIPKDDKFFQLFAEAAHIANEAVIEFELMLKNLDNREEYRERISKWENRGDDVTHETLNKIASTFVTPIDASDIQHIAMILDDITDTIHAAAERIAIYNVDEAVPESIEMAGIIKKCTVEIETMMNSFKNMKKADVFTKGCIEINRLENLGDDIYRRTLGRIYAEGDAMNFIRWKEIFVQLEEALNYAENLADVIQSVVIKEA